MTDEEPGNGHWHLQRWNALQERHPDVTLVARCLTGWLPLVERFLVEGKLGLPEDTRLVEVRARQKWGLLSLSYRVEPHTSDAYRGIINAAGKAESASRSVCETCGDPGRIRKRGSWLVTCCERHGLGQD